MTITSRNVRGDEHLPECPAYAKSRRGVWRGIYCICPALRACEQRVEQIWSVIAGRDQYAEGYGAALDAAREAVAAMWQYNGEQSNSLMIGYNRVLETIDALRGER